MHGIYSQENDKSVHIKKAMGRLMRFFLGRETNVTKETNHQRERTFNALAAHEDVSLNNMDDIRTDTLLRNN